MRRSRNGNSLLAGINIDIKHREIEGPLKISDFFLSFFLFFFSLVFCYLLSSFYIVLTPVVLVLLKFYSILREKAAPISTTSTIKGNLLFIQFHHMHGAVKEQGRWMAGTAVWCGAHLKMQKISERLGYGGS